MIVSSCSNVFCLLGWTSVGHPLKSSDWPATVTAFSRRRLATMTPHFETSSATKAKALAATSDLAAFAAFRVPNARLHQQRE
jgi:hypothetical protein